MLDQRGHGHSTKTGTLEGYSIEQLSRDLAGFLEAVGGGPVDLLGHSMGGRVVMTMAVQRPDLVHSLILMDTSAWSFQPDDESPHHGARLHRRVRPCPGHALHPQHGRARGRSHRSGGPAGVAAAEGRVFAGMDAYAVKALGMELWTELPDGDGSLRSRLPSITCPTTVIVGEHDHPLVGQALALAAEVADGRLTVIEGAYHSPQLTHPEQWRGRSRGPPRREGAAR